MSKGYVVSESRLRELLEVEARFDALESGGVDNWEWYGASMSDFLENSLDEPEVKRFLQDLRDEGVDIDDFGFEDLAEFELRGYSVIAENIEEE